MDSDRRILIADDAAMFRELGALFLARSGKVVTASNGSEALDVARRGRPSVIVADLDMPRMGGDELCRHIRQDPELNETPVILMTSSDEPEARARAVRSGADDVITKPISRIMLIQAVNRFLRAQGLRGLARVTIETDVHIVHERREYWGTARNLSRGGIFVEADCPTPPDTEVALEFALPEAAQQLHPTAQVIWRREPRVGGPVGLGLRFLALDRASVAAIDAFVYERVPTASAAAAGLAAAGGTR